MVRKKEYLMDKGFKYLARDKDGALYAYEDKPTKRQLSFMWETSKQDDDHQNCSLIYDTAGMYDTVQWEDEEPTEIKTLSLAVRKPFSKPFGLGGIHTREGGGMAVFKTESSEEPDEQPDDELDMIRNPPHYNKLSFQPIDIIAEVANYYEGSTAFYIGTVLKYLFRAPFKGKLLEDLKKANYYLTRAITEMEDDGE